ncbi:MAG: hypothetical protein GX130_05255 [Candidatus Hydrogenedens sp.]|jgi:hypothetical protein|nr:hypothetical protein [Candidatus Hydrogenedens sp.]
MKLEERLKTYLKHLTDEGYSPEIQKDGAIHFKFEGGNYLIILDEEDEEYFCLLYPNFYSVETDKEKILVMQAMSHVTCKTKYVKLFLMSDKLCATVEHAFSSPESFFIYFKESLKRLQTGVHLFGATMYFQLNMENRTTGHALN